MRRGDLFHGLFLRFLVALAAGFLLFLPLVHLLQLRMMSAWRGDLAEEARWLARHLDLGSAPGALAAEWARDHASVRLTLFDAAERLVADSHPRRDELDLASLRPGGRGAELGSAVELPGGGWLALSRPWSPAFPRGLQGQVAAAALVVLALVAAVLYPFVRSLSQAFARLTDFAGEVASGRFGGTVGIARRDQLGTLVAALDEMSRRLAEAERLERRLLHDVSHELRSPLGRIQALAETSAARPAEAAACLDGIEQEVALLDRLVGDLLAMARLESPEPALDLVPFPLVAWAEDTAVRLGARVRAAGIDWRIRLPAAQREVRGDRQRLTQAVANLVDNAVAAFADRPGRTIELDVDVHVDGEVDGWTWTLTVRDDGPGIPAADLPHVFRRFYRVERHRDRARGGVGLGLTLVRAIVAAHGGEVAIRCPEGGGTVVEWRIPLDATTPPVA